MKHFYIVVYDDGDLLCMPYGKNPDCEGALATLDAKKPIAGFSSIAGARAAIKMSAIWEELQKLQGEPFSDDFLDYKKNVKVRRVDVVLDPEDPSG